MIGMCLMYGNLAVVKTFIKPYFFQGAKKMNRKVFSQRFNRELSSMGLPEELSEKVKAVSKVFGVSRHLANAMIFGHLLPNKEQLDRIACVLEVCPNWLSGISDRKKAYTKVAEEA